MKVVILAGGRGKRLSYLTKTIPKPMLKINDKPLVEYSIDLFKEYKLTDIIFTLCYLPDVIQKHFRNGSKFNIKCSYILEDYNNPMGTAGALTLLINKLKETFIVCSGDSLRSSNINDVINFHKSNKGIATICVYKNNRPNPKSIIKLDKKNRISEFIERPKNILKNTVWSNTSLYIFEPEILSFIPKKSPSDFGKDIFPSLLRHNKKLFAYKEKGYFLDISTKEKIAIAEKDIQSKKFNI